MLAIYQQNYTITALNIKPSYDQDSIRWRYHILLYKRNSRSRPKDAVEKKYISFSIYSVIEMIASGRDVLFKTLLHYATKLF